MSKIVGTAIFKMPKVILASIILLSTICVVVESIPVPDDDIKNFDDLSKAWNENKNVEIQTGDGKTINLSTRDIILIAAASFIVLLILICCIGYCFCECMKSLICCICCCGGD